MEHIMDSPRMGLLIKLLRRHHISGMQWQGCLLGLVQKWGTDAQVGMAYVACPDLVSGHS